MSIRSAPDDLAATFLPDGRPDISGAVGGSGDVDGEDHNVDVYVEALRFRCLQIDPA